jgi:hypothetical protein
MLDIVVESNFYESKISGAGSGVEVKSALAPKHWAIGGGRGAAIWGRYLK